MSKNKVYIYNHISVDDEGQMVTNTVEETFEELEAKYWQNWADMRTVMQMPVTKKAFISDLEVILKMEEVEL